MSSPGATPPKPVRGLGPVIVVILIFVAALLGYYQIIYYPPHHTTTSTMIVPPDPHNVTVTIVTGASSPCGSGLSPPQPQSQCNGKTYVPDNVTVVIGYNATVIWRNNDSAVHTVTAEPSAASIDPRFASFGPTSQPWNNIESGKSVNFTFIKPGTYTYFCSYHSWMVGSVIVKAGTNSSSSSSASTVGPGSSSSLIGPYHINPLLMMKQGINASPSNLANFVTSLFPKWSWNSLVSYTQRSNSFISKSA
jgi:plastocyanin